MFRHHTPTIEQRGRDASNTLRELGIKHDAAKFHYSNVQEAVVASDIDNLLDIRIVSKDQRISSLRSSIDRRFLWNGRLRNDVGQVDKPSRFQKGSSSSLNVLSSPHDINLAQETLGRTLGQNAFRLERVQGGQKFSDGAWIRAFATGSVYVADPVASWDVATHDLSLSDHTMGWLHSNDEFHRHITESAQAIVADYGEKLDLPTDVRPPRIGVFANALEDLAIYVGPILKAVDDRAEAAAELDDELIKSTQDSLREFVDPATYDNTWSTNSSYRDFHALGMIPTSTREKRPGRIADVTARYAAHIAGTLLQIDQTWPRQDLTLEQQEARADALEAIKKLG